MPLFYGSVNQLLINLVPFIRDALLQFVNTGNLASINLSCMIPRSCYPLDSDLGYSVATDLEE